MFFCSSFPALALAPLGVELAIMPFLLTGLLLILEADYRRGTRVLLRPAAVRKTPERLRLAA